MEYRLLSENDKINGLINRIGQLEAEHYSNEIYKIEAVVLGDENALVDLDIKNKFLTGRIARLFEEIDALRVTDVPPDDTIESD